MAPFPWQLSATIHPFKDSFHVKCLTIVKLLQMHDFNCNHFSDSEKGVIIHYSHDVILLQETQQMYKLAYWKKWHHLRSFIQQTYHSILDDQLYIQCYCRTSRVNKWGMVFTGNETQYNPFQKWFIFMIPIW